ncbi:peptide-methionine (S)-S-oxide reductase MsrA [Pseudohoeflea coraliihabitans]|uniref:Peptide methionine sulfoxide reductase MsrA n=1 Tax=Pseudohoeflea coraliihabitans TaxID=2860393 RepID=A0ABS6WP56_9HYPH|nr:peptide-methionine (S)-S-oxide reductase MsrA [Pseudohoeflea sp. DP4N28-3]MBW3097749.1 peptide-methionine (S)-S-oxide reductase MsrA [Pseudohoeflea sp. DP4N28-3]
MFASAAMNKKTRMPEASEALPGRAEAIATAERNFVTGAALKADVTAGHEEAFFGMGCFWGAERLFWETPGVISTAVGYAGGLTPNPTYRETVTGLTGHAEIVRVVFDPAVVGYERLLALFFEAHDPTQGMRQGNDVGTTYRSALYTTSEAQLQAARDAAEAYQKALDDAGHGGRVTTEIQPAPAFFYAEEEHQQYLAKNPQGYCGLRGTGIACPIPSSREAAG